MARRLCAKPRDRDEYIEKLEKALNVESLSKSLHDIDKDINRSFPYHPYFNKEK